MSKAAHGTKRPRTKDEERQENNDYMRYTAWVVLIGMILAAILIGDA